MPKRITIKDIARELNMHHSTVSRALRNDSRVKVKTRKLVEAYAKDHGYQVNMSALQLRGSVRNVIAMIIPNINHNFFSNIVSLITNMAVARGYIVSIFQSNESYEQEKEIINTIIQNNVAGVIASVAMETEDSEHFRKLKDFKIPLVLFDRVCEDINVSKVVVNNAEVVSEAVDILVRNGCERIAHISGSQKVNVFRDRQLGYRTALKRHHKEYSETYFIDEGFTFEYGRKAANELFGNDVRPDGLICDSNMLLVGVLLEFKKMNIEVPEDVVVIGYSDNPFVEAFSPGLISIVQPDDDVARFAFDLLMEKLDGDNMDKTESITVSAKIVSDNLKIMI
jgi:LacI family transcriptional regulator